jgi:FKBP-type peptidyl-prolyl cis-trans isomerase 2
MNDKRNDGINLNDIITVDYSAKVKNGRTVLTTLDKKPLTFKVGTFSQILGFNKAVIGMKIGDIKKVTIQPKEAFGEIDTDLVFHVLLSEIPKFSRIGQRVKMVGKDDHFSVLDVDSDAGVAVLDSNHILAGLPLEFNIRILSIKIPPSSEQVAIKACSYFDYTPILEEFIGSSSLRSII